MVNKLRFPELNDPELARKLKEIRLHFMISRRNLEDILYIREGSIIYIEERCFDIESVGIKRTYKKLKDYFQNLIEEESLLKSSVIRIVPDIKNTYKTAWNKEFYDPTKEQKGNT
jgi:predicted transcriptional regulator